MAYSSSALSSWDHNLLSVDRGKAVHELLRGRHVATQLRDLLGKRKYVSDHVPAEDLVTQILNSFGTTLSVLNSSAPAESDHSDEVSQVPAVHVSEDSGGDSCKSTETLRERRACYKKRKTDNTYTKVTPDLIDDGYAWRKYGQKSILHNDFPRNYFRCTHKYDKPGCQASKQVQQISKDPPMFRITYINHHTCTNNFLKPPQIIFDPTPSDSSTMLCFQTSTVVSRQDHGNINNDNLVSPTCFATTSTATNEEEIRSDHNNSNNQSSSSDYHYVTSLPDSCTTTSSHGFEFDDVCDLKFVVDEGGYYHYQ